MNLGYSKKMKNLVIALFSLASLAYFTLGQVFIPNYFKADSNTIRIAMDSTTITGSYKNAANFYQLFGFNSNSPEINVQIFSWIIYVISVLTIAKISKDRMLSKSNLIMLCTYTFIYGFYFDTFSKDLILILFSILAINFFLYKKNYYVFCIVILIYGFLFREYWIFIGLMLLLTYVFKVKKINYLWIYFNVISFVIAYDLYTGYFITNYRLGVNINRFANSMIFNIIPNTSILTDLINYIYVYISMFIPLEGISSFNQIFFYVFIWLMIVVVYVNRKCIDSKIIYLIMFFINIQSCFEPDYGSWLRHLSASFLIFYLSIYHKKNEID